MIAIRVDMNNQIATGHLMRCLSIAEALRLQNKEVMFIIADEQPVGLLRQRNFRYIVLHTKWNDMESEVQELTKIIIDENIDKLLIDSYQVTYKYLEAISNITKTIYIDDLGKFEYPVNAIVCYANYWKKMRYELDNLSIQYYLGTQYVPLRSSFWNIHAKVVSDKIKSLLILSGGSDPYNISEKILEKIDREKYEEINVVCGIYNERYNYLVEKYSQEVNVKIFRNIDDIYQLMVKTDIAISAGGTTLYELCACGTPTISYTFADNQLKNVIQFDEDRVIPYAGDFRKDNTVDNIKLLLEGIMNDHESRKRYSIRMKQLVDGKGAWRLAKKLKTI